MLNQTKFTSVKIWVSSELRCQINVFSRYVTACKIDASFNIIWNKTETQCSTFVSYANPIACRDVQCVYFDTLILHLYIQKITSYNELLQVLFCNDRNGRIQWFWTINIYNCPGFISDNHFFIVQIIILIQLPSNAQITGTCLWCHNKEK